MKRNLIQKLFLFTIVAIFLVTLLSIPSQANAKDLKYGSPHEITIKAVVPLLPEYKFLISKNSRIIISDKNVKPEENIDFSVELRGFENKALKNQSVFVVIRNSKTGKTLQVIPYDMNSETGVAKFSLNNSEDFSGRNIVQAYISTYKEPIAFKKEASFTVKKPNLIEKLFE